MEHNNEIIHFNQIENRIFTIHGVPVMLDRDLAELYQIETKYINRAVKRNPERFPNGFAFQLTSVEFAMLQEKRDLNFKSESLRFRIGTLNKFSEPKNSDPIITDGRGKHSKYLPWAFSEEGVAMLSAVLHSEKAVEVSIKIIQAFVLMRKSISNFSMLSERVNKIEWTLTDHDLKFEKVFNALEASADAPKQGIFFEGQIFDA